MAGNVTIYDVAQRAGVSKSTVSLVLNAPDRVTARTRERVLSVIDELEFVPKAEAVTRARRGVGRIGVIAPFSAYPSFARRLNGVFAATRGQSCEVVVFDQASAATSALASLPLTGRLDGLIVMSIPFDDDIAERLVQQNIPTVLLEFERPDFSSVTIDDAAGGRMAAELLVRGGHTSFGFIGEAERHTHAYPLQSDARLAGFREALEARGLELPESNVRRVEHTVDAGVQAAAELLDLPAAPTAIFAHDDILAAAVLQVARARNLSVPDELAIVGFDDSDIAAHLGLTSIRQPLEESGEVATETLLGLLAKKHRSLQHVTLKLSVVERQTT